MNRRLVDQFQSVQLPETVEQVLDRGTATCAEFNPWGTLLAAGGALGEVIIWDFETKGVARASQPHDQAVTSLAWTRDGRHVVSAAGDRTVSSLSILDNKQVAKVEVRAQPISVSVNKGDPAQVLVCFKEGLPALLDLSSGTSRPVPCIPVETEVRKGSRSALSGQLTASAVFSRDGRCIYLGQSRGLLSVLDTANLRFLDTVKLPGQPRITSVKLDSKGRRLLASCSDRVIRWALLTSPAAQEQPASFSAEEAATRVRAPPKEGGAAQQAGLLTLSRQEFHNTVERVQWQGAAFSQDSEHMVGVTPEHKVYAWSLHSGKLEKFLEFEGTSDDCAYLAWHPQRSCFVTVGSSGKIYVWAKVYKENWSAFAPDFEELTENKEYVEREDEFDVNPRSPERPAHNAEGDNEEIDVVTCEPVEALYYSTDEDPASAPPRLHHLPLEIEPQRPSTPEPNADEDADADGGDSDDVDVVSISPPEGSQQRQLPGEGTTGKRKRAPARSRSRSRDEEDHQAAPRQRSLDGGPQQHKNLLSGLNELDLPQDMF